MPETGGTGKTKQRQAEGEASETGALGNTAISIRTNSRGRKLRSKTAWKDSDENSRRRLNRPDEWTRTWLKIYVKEEQDKLLTQQGLTKALCIQRVKSGVGL